MSNGGAWYLEKSPSGPLSPNTMPAILIPTHLIGAQGARAIGGQGDVGEEELGACHLQRAADTCHPAPRQQLPESARHAASNHACAQQRTMAQDVADLCCPINQHSLPQNDESRCPGWAHRYMTPG